jgi:hypothetical protein
MSVTFDFIFSQFHPRLKLISIEPFGTGHIHDTYKLIAQNQESFILQKINKKVFPNIPALQHNIEKVIEHMCRKNMDSTHKLTILKSTTGKSYFADANGDYWRLFNFIPESKSFNRVLNADHAYEAGKAFGEFQKMFKDFPYKSLHETLPNFHHIDHRLQLFEISALKNPMNRAEEVKNEIDFVRLKARRMRRILLKGQADLIPIRVTHNDTKINNVLFDLNDKAICVIDLDTVMPGYIHYDFGDAIRTGAAAAVEDETDLNKMFIDLKLFEAYSRGFLEQTIGFMNRDEIDELFFAPQLLTFIIALRFLTDYLNGDVYFKVDTEKHNLQRWYAQKQLLASMEENEIEMQQILKRIENKLKNES